MSTLMLIAAVDLISTAALHSQGKIVELNPLMAVLIDRSEWLFVLVKGSTIVGGGLVLNHFAKAHPRFVRSACFLASGTYLSIWGYFFFQPH